jgi:hypothetical protein
MDHRGQKTLHYAYLTSCDWVVTACLLTQKFTDIDLCSQTYNWAPYIGILAPPHSLQDVPRITCTQSWKDKQSLPMCIGWYLTQKSSGQVNGILNWGIPNTLKVCTEGSYVRFWTPTQVC